MEVENVKTQFILNERTTRTRETHTWIKSGTHTNREGER